MKGGERAKRGRRRVGGDRDSTCGVRTKFTCSPLDTLIGKLDWGVDMNLFALGTIIKTRQKSGWLWFRCEEISSVESNKVAACKVRTYQHASFALTLHGVCYTAWSIFFFNIFIFLIGSEIDPIINVCVSQVCISVISGVDTIFWSTNVLKEGDKLIMQISPQWSLVCVCECALGEAHLRQL